MDRLLPDFEQRTQPVIPESEFVLRLAQSGLIAFALIILSLGFGMAGYCFLEHLSLIDAFLNASMLLGGMGPVNIPVTASGKLFAGLFALYSGLVFIFVAGIIFAPVAHRVLHRFHMDASEQRADQ